MNFSNLASLVIPEGNVTAITFGGKLLWRKRSVSNYVELEYLEGTGTQYINTGLFPPKDAEIYIKYQLTQTEQGAANNGAIFGGRNTQTSGTCTLFYLASANPQYFRFDRVGQVSIGNSNTLSINAQSVFEFLYKDNKASVTNLTTGESASVTLGNPSTFTATAVSLFAVRTSGQAGTFLKGRIYEWKYWEGGKLAQHFVPVLDLDNRPCMYDKVTDKLFYNSGSGEFLYG